MKVCVVGLGLIGGSLAKDLSGLGLASQVIGVENHAQNAKMALELGLVKEILPLTEAVSSSDVIILAVPVDQILKILPTILDRVKENAVVTDMGSTKETLCEVVKKHPKRKQFVAAHPMAGTENSGPKAALAGLFAHKTAVICEREKSSPEALGAITKILDGLRMRIVYMNPKDHDLHAAYVSHLSHISSFVLANTVLLKERDAATIFDLAGGGFESTVRLAKSSSQMWAPIFAQNKNKVSQALQVYIDELKTFKDAVDKEDMPKLVKLMDRANEIRRVLNEMARRTRE